MDITSQTIFKIIQSELATQIAWSSHLVKLKLLVLQCPQWIKLMELMISWYSLKPMNKLYVMLIHAHFNG